MAPRKKKTRNEDEVLEGDPTGGTPDWSLEKIRKLQEELAQESPVSIAREDLRVRIPGVISTQCATLDWAIGRGGVPMARMTVIAGSPNLGKSTTCLHICAEAQQMGGIAGVVDAENKLDLGYAESIGVNIDALLTAYPRGLEDCMAQLARMARRTQAMAPGRPVALILDSINAERTEAEYESEDYRPQAGGIAGQARSLSYGLPKLARELGGKPVALIVVSQPRDAGIGSGMAYREAISGGKSLKHYAALVIDFRKGETWKEADRSIGVISKVQIPKNQVGAPFRECEIHIRVGSGIDYVRSLVERGVVCGLVNRGANSWHESISQSGETLRWQSTKGLDKILDKHPEFIADLKAKVYERMAGAVAIEQPPPSIEEVQDQEIT